MFCPKCYGRVNKNTQRCEYCGMRMSEMEGATNADAKFAMKGIYKDDVLMTRKLPSDVSKKTILLLSIFLGLFGVHNFYVGRKARGVYQIASLALMGLGYLMEFVIFGAINGKFSWVFQILEGVAIIIWLGDILTIAINRYKVPVYKIEFSKEKKK